MAGFDAYKNVEDFRASCGYDIDGLWYPRVTKIVDIKKKPALYHFYASVGFRRAKVISQKSAEEGTIVHEVVERLLTGQKAGEVPAFLAPSIYAFLDFMRAHDIVVDPSHVERRIHDPEHRYAGTVDALATIDGKFGVLDIKTSSGIYRDYDLQTSAYFHALKKEFPDLETRWILRIDQHAVCEACGATQRIKGGRTKIKKNGKDSCSVSRHAFQDPIGVVELQEMAHPWERDFEGFLGAKKLWEWQERAWLTDLGYL